MDLDLETRPYGAWIFDFEKKYPPKETWQSAPRTDGVYTAKGLRLRFFAAKGDGGGDVEINGMRFVHNEVGGGWVVREKRAGFLGLFGHPYPKLSIESRLWHIDGPIGEDRLFLTCNRVSLRRGTMEPYATAQVIAHFEADA